MVIKTPGTANLQADPHTYNGSENASPSGSGKDCGGTTNLKADHTVYNGADKSPPTTYRHDVPAGLQSFDDNGQEAGGTKYLGRE